MRTIEFQGVTKQFRTGKPAGLKDLILGSKRERHVSSRIEAVRDLSFSIDSGEVVALLGHNGSGKSTTLKLLAGTIYPTRGQIESQGRLAPLLELGAGFHPDLTGKENIYLNAALLGVPKSYLRNNIDKIIDFSGIGSAIDSTVRFYSSGMQVRLGFSIAAHVDAEIILIDEVLAVGDSEFQTKCLQRMNEMKQNGKTIILVTHSYSTAVDFADRAIVLQSGSVVYDGPIDRAKIPFERSSVGSPHIA